MRLQRDRIAGVFDDMDDAYLRSRIDDIDQVIGRVHAALHRRARPTPAASPAKSWSTDNIAPAELAQLQAQGVMAVITAGGSALSHSAILARSLHLPLVVGARAGAAEDQRRRRAGGRWRHAAWSFANPTPQDLRAHRARTRDQARERKQLNRLRREPSRTLDGVDIKLWANAESRDDVAEAHALGAAGVGLYRTEFLFLNSATNCPTRTSSSAPIATSCWA